jgi:hypothetical protein
MPRVLTLKPGGTVTCGHGTGDVATAGVAKLQVGGASVLLEDSVVNKAVSGCGTPPASDMSGPTAKACSKVVAVVLGKSTKLQVGGFPVLLDTLTGTTDGMVLKVTPQALLAGKSVQAKLTAI